MSHSDGIIGRLPASRDEATPGLWSRCMEYLGRINRGLAYLIGLPVAGFIGTAFVGHFQYISSYHEKVTTVANQQLSAAEAAFGEISTTFSKAITLQQILYFNYRDAVKDDSDGDERAMETKNARARYQHYDDLRTSLRENIDLLARNVELKLDWATDDGRDSATALVGGDPMSRIALGNYDFDCDDEKYMPHFAPGKSQVDLPPPPAVLRTNPKAQPIGIDWFSAKHNLLTLYYCFETNHRRIAVVRKWAANSPVDAAEKERFVQKLDETQGSFDRVALRLNAFMILAGHRVEDIHVKFRPRAWYCHTPFVREIIDFYSKMCRPVRTAEQQLRPA
jgi:hypothetical protein